MEGLNFHQKTETKQVLVGAHISSFKKNPNRFSMLEESNKKNALQKHLIQIQTQHNLSILPFSLGAFLQVKNKRIKEDIPNQLAKAKYCNL